ncbi:MAG: hypothetical protein QM733_09085 [Ilumatobacteraceae bacterium]
MPHSPIGRRVVIVGAPGAGKSHLARELGRLIGVAPVHLDRLFASPSVGNQPRAEWEAAMRDLIAGPMWIVDGHYSTTLPLRIGAADTVVLLDVPVWRCLWRVCRRQGTPRPDWPPDVPERRDAAFVGLLRDIARDHRSVVDEVYRVFAEKASGGAVLVHLAGTRAQRRFLRAVERGTRSLAPQAPVIPEP